MNILVVDDQELNLQVAKGYLNVISDDYNIFLCKDSRETMDLLNKRNFDIVLLDIMMPHIDGITLLKEIRANDQFKNIQVLMLTAVSDEESFAKCFEIGANDYLNKPINIVELQARLKSAISSRQNEILLKKMYEEVKKQNDELIRMNEELKQVHIQLAQKEKLSAIGELAAGIAHEINNPIGYISSNLNTMIKYMQKMGSVFATIDNQEISNQERVDLLKKEYKKMNISYILNDIESISEDSKEGIDKISQIVSALVGFAKATEENKTHISFNDIVSQVLLIMKNEYRYNITIEKNLDDKQVFVNANEISQVIVNVLGNAIYALKANQIKNGVITINSYKEGNYTCLSIKDNGPGIGQEVIEKIFNPFYTNKPVGQGVGLGLSVSYDIIVNKHKGLIDVISKEGDGAEFIIKVP